MTLAHLYTVAFEGLEAREVDVQVHIAPGIPSFSIVGLADKAVGESRERVRAALSAVGLALPVSRITVNLAPADLPKEGSHWRSTRCFAGGVNRYIITLENARGKRCSLTL